MQVPSKTTLAGFAAGISYATAQVPDMPPQCAMTLKFIAALSFFMIGYHAKDCPANCPGTDQEGNPRQPDRQIKLPIAGLVFLFAATVLCGCTMFTAHTTHTEGTTDQPARETTEMTGWTFFDSGQAMARASANSGYATNNTHSPGISMNGLNQWSSSTGAVQVLRIVVESAAPAAAALPK